jgi:hypothetical protein
MEQGSERQIARNEAIFRDVNEALRGGHWPGEESDPIAFRCEFGELGCSRLIELAVREYERVRSDSRQFFVSPDHDSPDLETIVERHPSYVVVRKRGEAGRAAGHSDPRD